MNILLLNHYFFFNTASFVLSVSKRFNFHVKYSCNTVIVFRFARVVCIASSNASFALDFSLVYGVQYRSITIAFRS